jgi:hypothetical protein
MTEPEVSWVPVAVFAAGFEADLALAPLDSAGILAVRRDNDTVGIFGPGFQGATARGVSVLVPSDVVSEAKRILAPEDGTE